MQDDDIMSNWIKRDGVDDWQNELVSDAGALESVKRDKKRFMNFGMQLKDLIQRRLISSWKSMRENW